jgi:PRTRC genetic system ThiF family protein
MASENVHLLSDCFLHHAEIHVVGCGGTGSQLLPRLAQLSKCMIALGHPCGLEVTVWDGDTVSEHNCLRQNFFPPDVGHNKASIMVNRLNIAHGLAWRDEARPFSHEAMGRDRPDFIIGCVDSRAARREIDAFARDSYHAGYWIDAGNDAVSGQVIVGQFGKSAANDPLRLPLVSELFPEIVAGADDNAPSCSARESILKQGLATNAMVAAWIYAWLAEALRFGQIGWSGVFFNLANGRSSSIPVSQEAWDAIRPAMCFYGRREAD